MALQASAKTPTGIQEYQRDPFVISTDPARLDIAAIHSFLATRSWWARGIPRETVERSIAGSLCFGVYDGDKQIGFARVITDGATFAYLCDDYLLEDYRGRGLGKWLMQCIFSHPELQNIRRWLVIAEDPRLYASFGFRPLEQPEINMEMINPYKAAPTAA
ncbi:MAG TPA: GNAT family N-acetyltransferase [Terriglobales bacterium]|jgi:GNAT superfamily N-acetyltransferase|nr:GNAT family N-acetyltransferase [Terriglobales bacterium]